MVATNDTDNYQPERIAVSTGSVEYEPTEYEPYKTMRRFTNAGAKVGWCNVPSFGWMLCLLYWPVMRLTRHISQVRAARMVRYFAGFILHKGHHDFNRCVKLKRN